MKCYLMYHIHVFEDETKDYKINFAYLTVTKDTNIYRTDNEIHELKNLKL